MTPPCRAFLLVPSFLLASASLFAQNAPGDTRPGINKPTKIAKQKDLDHVEALKLYSQGLLHEKDQRILEALKAFQEVMRLDPDAAEPHRAVIPLYLALDRTDEALAEFQRVNELDPADVENQYRHARLLRGLGKTKDALAVLEKAAGRASLKERPDLGVVIFNAIASIHEDAGEWPAAEKALRALAAALDNVDVLTEDGNATAAEVNAQAADTWERIGRIEVKTSQPEKAIIAFQNAQKKDPSSVQRLSLNLAELNEKQGKLREALAQIDTYLRMQPQGVEGYEIKVRLLRRLDRGADVAGELEKAAKADPHNTALKLLLAHEYRERQPGTAEAVYKDLIKDTPSPEAFKGLLAVYKDQGDAGARRLLMIFNDAVAGAADKASGVGDANQAAVARGLLTATREDPVMVKRMLTAAMSKVKLAPATRQLLAVLASRTHEFVFAEELFRGCLEDGHLTEDAEADIYSGLLSVLWQAHQYKKVLEVCDRGLKEAKATSRVLFHVDRSDALAALGKFDEAIEAAEAAVKDSKEKDRLLTRRILADRLSQAGKHEQALAECQALLKEYNLAGDVRNIRVTLSAIYLAAQKYDESEKELQLVLETDPNDALANNDLGYQWADRSKNLEEAEKMIRRALELDRKERANGGPLGPDADRDNAAYVDSLGWVLFRRGKLDEARTQLELATTLPDGADDPAVWDHLGDVYFRLQEKSKALATYKKALELFAAGRRLDADRKKDVEKKIRLLES